MKNMIFAAIAALFVSVNCAMAQSVEFGSEKKGLVSEASAEMQEIAKVDSMTLDYIGGICFQKT